MSGALDALSDRLSARLAAGEILSDADMTVLAGTTDILTLGMLGDEARRRVHGAATTFVRVAEVTIPVGDGHIQIPPSAREIMVVGAVDALDSVLPELRRVVESAAGVPVSAFSLADLEALESPLADVLNAIRDAGVMAIAEAPIDRLRTPERSLEAVHASGLELARLTVDHTGSPDQRVAQIKRASALQKTLGWVRSFAPLARRWEGGAQTTGYEDVRQVALARLLAPNIPSIQVDWSLYGPKLAQVALTVGADDVDRVSAIDDMGEGRRRAPLEEIRRNIQAAALTPVERDGAYRRLDR